MKKLLAAMLTLLVLVSCSSGVAEPSESQSQSPSTTFEFTTKPDILGKDLLIYLTELGKIGTLENEVVGLFDAVSGPNFKDDPTLLKQLEVIIPKSQEFLAKLEAIQGTQPEITSFHNKYVAVWQKQVPAFSDLKKAIESNDSVLYESALGIIVDARRGIEPLQAEIKALTEYAGIELQF